MMCLEASDLHIPEESGRPPVATRDSAILAAYDGRARGRAARVPCASKLNNDHGGVVGDDAGRRVIVSLMAYGENCRTAVFEVVLVEARQGGSERGREKREYIVSKRDK